MEDEINNIKKLMKKLNISISDVKKIVIKYEKIFHDKAFPKIEIELK